MAQAAVQPNSGETSSKTADPADGGPDAQTFALIRSAIEEGLAFNRHVGIEIHGADETAGVACLPEVGHVLNHVGTVHAAALFLIGECAAGAAFVGAFLEDMERIRFVARSADIGYVAAAKGAVTATAALNESADAVRAKLRSDHRARASATVTLRDPSGTLVAEMTVQYDVKSTPAT